MIEDLKISYVDGDGINISLTPKLYDYSLENYYENLPYDLANIFSRIIKDSDANSDIIIEEIQEKFKQNNL